MVINLSRVYGAAFGYELQQLLCLCPAGSGPWAGAVGGNAGKRSRMHERLQGTGNEAVVDKEVLRDFSSDICVRVASAHA
jgi:hypothetical protein